MDFEKLCDFHLDKGGHDKPEHGLCAMEAVAWLDGQAHSAGPKGVCETLGGFVMMLNDNAPSDAARQDLIPFLPRLVQTDEGGMTLKMRRVAMTTGVAKLVLEKLGGGRVMVQVASGVARGVSSYLIYPLEDLCKTNNALQIEDDHYAAILGDMLRELRTSKGSGCTDFSPHHWPQLLAVLSTMLMIGTPSPGFDCDRLDALIAKYRELPKEPRQGNFTLDVKVVPITVPVTVA